MDDTLQQVNQSVGSTHSATKRDLRWVFMGPNGLRAGWSILLFIAIFLVTDVLTGWLFRSTLTRIRGPLGHNAPMSLGSGLVLELIQASGMVVATLAMALIERRPILSYGYLGRARAVRFLFGLAWGFLAITAVVLALWKAGLLAFDGQMIHGAAILKYGVGWGIGFLMVGIFEESLLRGYVQFTMTRGVGFWWGALLFSFLFGFSHGSNPGETPVGLFSAGAVGLVFCLSLWYTGSLWWAVGFHAAWDWGQSFFYGTSDSGVIVQGHLFSEHPVGPILWSGGPTGPEGSILVLILLAIAALLMRLWWGPRAEKPFTGAAWRPLPLPRDQERSLPLAS